jgi:hypothetical protein
MVDMEIRHLTLFFPQNEEDRLDQLNDSCESYVMPHAQKVQFGFTINAFGTVECALKLQAIFEERRDDVGARDDL